MLFTGYGAFSLSLWAIAEFFLKSVPLLQVGHALGLFLYAFGIFTVVMLAASLRTSVIVVTTLFLLGVTFFVLGAGNYGASSGLIKAGGWIGLAVAALAFYLGLADPESFWGEAAKGIDWYREPTVVLDTSNPLFYRWFADGVLNTCFNALDRHVRDGRGDQVALIHDSPVTDTCRTFSYRELLDEVARFGGVLHGLGVGAGDRVIIYMPMIPQAVVAMLACARVGAVHSVVFGGFAAHELAVRIDDATPKVVVSASCGIEVSRIVEYAPILDRAIELAAHKPERCVIVQRPQAPAALVA